MENEPNQTVLVEPRTHALSENRRLLLEKRMRGLTGRKAADEIGPRPLGPVVPLSAEQRRIWLHASQQTDSDIYNEPITIRKSGSFSLEIFRASFNEMVRRHEAWRTSFNPDGTSFVHPLLEIDLPFTDVSNSIPGLAEKEALRIATEDAALPLPLAQAPLFRAQIVKVSAEDHRLYLTLHHIIFDGVSLSAILLPELAAIYEAFEHGRPSPLPEPKVQYGDYAVWRERQLTSPTVRKHLDYWVKQLGGELPVLRLPTDRPRPPIPSQRGSMERFTLSAELTSDLRAFSRARGVTIYMTLLAAYKVLLFRYSGQEDLIVGSAIDARRHPDLKQVMGYFLDTVAIRTRPSAETPFEDFLIQTRNSVLDALATSDVPFDRVVHEVRPRRDSSHHPIFQAFFSMRPVMGTLPPGWKLNHLDVTAGAVKFDIYLELGEQIDDIEGRILYSTDLFDPSTIKRMQAHLLVLLRSLCDAPATALGRLSIFGAEERALLLGTQGWNATAASFPQTSLQALIEGQVQRTPDAIAAVFAGQQFTYQQLNARSMDIAEALSCAGVRSGSLVAVAVDRSLDLLAGLLGVLRLGAAYLPLDTVMARERIEQCLAHAKPAAVLTRTSLLRKFEGVDVQKVIVENVPHGNDKGAADSRPALESGSLSDTAYVIYTSGTTGEPKAVDIPQSALINFLTSMQRAPGFSQSDTLLALTSVSFDIAGLELFVPLISGGTVVLASREEVQDPYLLARAIKQSRCTVVQATPATWRTLLRSGWKDAECFADDGKRTRLRILCGGESMTGELAEQLLATGAEVWNMYGPTETTIWSLIHCVSSEDTAGSRSIPVGLPIANTQAYILDRGLELVPLGVPGDLFLGGVGLAKGYRGAPGLTAERFFTVEAVGRHRLYLTGDLAVRRVDGNVEVKGRTDNQVKVRGYRVELEAVEAAVVKHPGVSAAAARVWPEPTGDSRLSVYVVGRTNEPPTLADLRSFLASRLPDYMIPSDVIPLLEMPLSTSGKVDRSRLPAPMAETKAAPQRSAWTPEEAGLAAIWTSLLAIDAVDRNDDFFLLGGHSVLVAELQQKILQTFGLQIPMAELFHQPTIRLQADLLKRARENNEELSSGTLQLQAQGTDVPIFWLHFATEALAKAVGTDQPFYSIVLTADEVAKLGEEPTLQEIAEIHVRKIKRIQPEGPYRLGGFCVGGVLAYEVACLLRKEDQKTSKLVLVDSPNPNPYAIKRFYRYSKWVLGNGGFKGLVYSIEKRLEDLSSLLRKRRVAENEMRTTQDTIEGATSRYHPGKYDGSILLVQASDRLHMDLLPPWKDVVTTGLQTRYVDGHHDDLMKAQNVGDVGSVIRDYLLSKTD